MFALVGVGALAAFFFADAGRILLEINIAMTAKRRTAFTQMDRTTLQRRLSCLTKGHEFLRLQSGKYV
jgi:hypothetical protein